MKNLFRTTIVMSFAGHVFLLGLPGFNYIPTNVEKPKEIEVLLNIEKPKLLPKVKLIDIVKKLKDTEEIKPSNEIVAEKEEIERIVEDIVPEETVMVAEEIIPQQIEPVEIPVEEPEALIEKVPQEEIKAEIPDEKAVFRYRDIVKQKIEEKRRYPFWAKKQGIAGTVYVQFVILKNGSWTDLQIVRSSSKAILDKEVIATINRINRFPSIPEELGSGSVEIEVPVVFNLE